jgi:DNA replication initiation complex subunit (GINS family)
MAPDDGFSFETLSKQEVAERKSPRLLPLDARFWDQLWTYLDQLETAYMKAHAQNPAARKTILLSDELRNGVRKAEGLWEARERKITLHAMKAGRQEAETRPENLTAEEAPFFDNLLALFRGQQRRVLRPREVKAEPAPAPSPAKPAASAPVPAAPAAKADDIATVRALVDIPPFVGLDAKTYKLKKGEVATIPRKMADILKKSGKIVTVG